MLFRLTVHCYTLYMAKKKKNQKLFSHFVLHIYNMTNIYVEVWVPNVNDIEFKT